MKATPTTPFKVIAVSNNRNSFGLTGIVLIAQDGEAWDVAANDLNRKEQGEVVQVPLTESGNLDFAQLGFEIPRRLPQAPPAVIAEAWTVIERSKPCPTI